MSETNQAKNAIELMALAASLCLPGLTVEINSRRTGQEGSGVLVSAWMSPSAGAEARGLFAQILESTHGHHSQINAQVQTEIDYWRHCLRMTSAEAANSEPPPVLVADHELAHLPPGCLYSLRGHEMLIVYFAIDGQELPTPHPVLAAEINHVVGRFHAERGWTKSRVLTQAEYRAEVAAGRA